MNARKIVCSTLYTQIIVLQHTYSYNLTGKVKVFVAEIRAIQILDVKITYFANNQYRSTYIHR